MLVIFPHVKHKYVCQMNKVVSDREMSEGSNVDTILAALYQSMLILMPGREVLIPGIVTQ